MNVDNLLKEANVTKDDLIIVACSGGPDSMYLLNTLFVDGYNIICAHVNHNLRKESIDEYKFVENYCKKNNIKFEGISLHDLPSSNTEIVARVKRYEFFESLVKKYKADYLVTAHHGDDLMETILMRIVRGSTLQGYSGFNFITDKGYYKIIRPLITMTKKDIIEYNDSHNIQYVNDNSNDDDLHTRNRYRHHILPVLKEEDPNVHLKFLKFSNTLKDYYDYVNKIVYKCLDDAYQDNILDLDMFYAYDDLIKKNILFEILRKWYPDNLYLVSDNNINEINKLIISNKANSILKLPDNIEVIKNYNKLEFVKGRILGNGYSLQLNDKVSTPMGSIKFVDDSDDTSNNVLRLNSTQVKLPLIVRTRRDGDKMVVKNMIGSKKINDIFIDSKVKMSDREIMPLVLDGNGIILWVPGIKKSNLDVQFNGDYDIILKYEKGDINNEE
ncbi:MAG TPA: tRNA lysidine(34) synthetase TilS [Bacilli bacterium]|nr:tRNA lysidine(34) synthetase TilS [Bacilli bacterium]